MVRLLFITDLDPSCCGGAPFLPDHVMEQAPEDLKDLVSDSEWFSAMSRLQSVTLKETVSLCTQLTMLLCFPILGCLCGSNYILRKLSNCERRIRLAIQEVNAQVFAPKGMYAAMKIYGRGEHSFLIIALDAEETKILQSEFDIIH